MQITFFVEGIPAPGGSKKAFPIKKGGQYTGRVAVVDAGGQKTKDWKQNVVKAAFEAMQQNDMSPLECPLEVDFCFRMPRPKSHYRSNGSLKGSAPEYPVSRPDCSKIIRSTEDAMTGIVWKDDAQIVDQHGHKRYIDPPLFSRSGCAILITTIE